MTIRDLAHLLLTAPDLDRSEDEEYEKGCLSIALIVVIIFIALTVVILSYEL